MLDKSFIPKSIGLLIWVKNGNSELLWDLDDVMNMKVPCQS